MNNKKQSICPRWWLLVSCCFLVAGLAIGLGAQGAQAARPAATLGIMKPVLPACSQCISDVTPADGSTAQTDANGNVTITATAQLNNNYMKFTFTIDQVDVDPAKVQVAGAPTSPTATVVVPLTAGSHHVFVGVFDATGLVTSFGWNFTVVVTATPTSAVTPTTVPTVRSGGSDGGTNINPTAAKSGLVLNTVSLVFFLVAVAGLLVIAFIAGMWYGGRRLPSA
jgi:hypothetical protein